MSELLVRSTNNCVNQRVAALGDEDLVTEQDLVDQLGLSRRQARKYLQFYVAHGVLESLPRRGYRLRKEPPAWVIEDALWSRKRLEHSLMEEIVKGGMDASVLRVRQAKLKEAAEALKQTITCLPYQRRERSLAFSRCDREWHATLADIAGRPGVRALIEDIWAFMLPFHLADLTNPTRIDEVVQEHNGITEELLAPGANSARLRKILRMYANHLDRGCRRNKTRMEESLREHRKS
jgi:DNA-binding GntR family transcriptional regulator